MDAAAIYDDAAQVASIQSLVADMGLPCLDFAFLPEYDRVIELKCHRIYLAILDRLHRSSGRSSYL